MRTSAYLVGGLRTDDDVTRLCQRLADIGVAEGIGAVTVERYPAVGREPGRDVLTVKHADAVAPDLGALRKAAARAGRLTLDPLPLPLPLPPSR